VVYYSLLRRNFEFPNKLSDFAREIRENHEKKAKKKVFDLFSSSFAYFAGKTFLHSFYRKLNS